MSNAVMLFSGFISYILFAYFSVCHASIIVDNPAPLQGSRLLAGQEFTLTWSGPPPAPVMEIQLRDFQDEGIRADWLSIDASRPPIQRTFPMIPSGKYYFWCGRSNTGEVYGLSQPFNVLQESEIASSVPTKTTSTLKPDTTSSPQSITTRSQKTTIRSPSPITTTIITSISNTPFSFARPSSVDLSSHTSTTGPSANQTSNTQSNNISASNVPSTTVATPKPSLAGAATQSGNKRIGPIIGGSLGATAIVIAIFTFFFCRRRNSSRVLRLSATIKNEEKQKPSLPKPTSRIRKQQPKIISEPETNLTASNMNGSDHNSDSSEVLDLRNQMEILNVRIRQLEVQEQENQDDHLLRPPTYTAARQSLDTASFAMHKSPLSSTGTGSVGT